MIALVPLRDLFDPTAVTDPAVYNPDWPAGLGGSPLSVLLTTLAVLGVALALRGAGAEARRRPLPFAVFVATMCATALFLRLLLGAHIAHVAGHATVRLFAVDLVLPSGAGGVLFGGFVVSGCAAVLLLEALWRWTAPERASTIPMRTISWTVGALVLTPLWWSDARFQTVLAVIGVVGFASALAAAAFGRGAAARAAALPLGVAIGVFAPAQRGMLESARTDVEALVEQHASDLGGGRAERLQVESVLAKVAASPRLAAALQGGNTPPDLAAKLWGESVLATMRNGSGLDVVPIDPDVVERRSYAVGLPPPEWLPDPAEFPGPDPPWVAVFDNGRRAGLGGRWVIGERRVDVDSAPVASVRVYLQLRAPTAQTVSRLPSIEDFRPSERTAELPPMDVYRSSGHLLRPENPSRPAGERLDDATVRHVVAEGRPLWNTIRVGEDEVDVLLHPRRDDDGETDGAVALAFTASTGRRMLLNATKAALFGAFLSLVALIVSAPWWSRGARLRFSYRLVISYAVVAALPLIVLAWINRELVRGRETAARNELVRERVSNLATNLRAAGVPSTLEKLRAGDVATGIGARDYLRTDVPGLGYPQGIYLQGLLGIVTDHGLLGTPVMPPRIDGAAHLEVTLLQRPFHSQSVTADDASVVVGYAPLRSPDGQVVGALSVPVIQSARLRRQEEADTNTTIAGFYLCSLVTVMAVGAFLARRLSAPLRSLREGTRRVAHGDLSRPVPAAGGSEMTHVIDAFNGMMSDLSDSRERLVKAEKEAAWRDMARQVAHEVKNPLTPMRLAAEHLRRAHQDRHKDFDSILHRSVAVIIRQTETLRRIVTDFRDFARLPVQRRDPVDVGALVHDVMSLYREVPNVEVTLDVDDEVPAVLADPDELRRVFVNVAGNSVEALDGRKGTLAARVTTDGEFVVSTLVDDGPGVPDDILPRLFEPSFSTKTGGTGLGLAICKRAIEDLGGTIELESARGEGTKVTIRIPRAPTEGATRPPPSTLG